MRVNGRNRRRKKEEVEIGIWLCVCIVSVVVMLNDSQFVFAYTTGKNSVPIQCKRNEYIDHNHPNGKSKCQKSVVCVILELERWMNGNERRRMRMRKREVRGKNEIKWLLSLSLPLLVACHTNYD